MNFKDKCVISSTFRIWHQHIILSGIKKLKWWTIIIHLFICSTIMNTNGLIRSELRYALIILPKYIWRGSLIAWLNLPKCSIATKKILKIKYEGFFVVSQFDTYSSFESGIKTMLLKSIVRNIPHKCQVKWWIGVCCPLDISYPTTKYFSLRWGRAWQSLLQEL